MTGIISENLAVDKKRIRDRVQSSAVGSEWEALCTMAANNIVGNTSMSQRAYDGSEEESTVCFRCGDSERIVQRVNNDI